MKTSVLLDHEPVADGGFFVRALIRIEGDPPEDGGGLPLNLSLVLDRSGSMSGEPLRAACTAAAMLVQRLRLGDLVSVVACDDQVRVVAPPATGHAQTDVLARIRSIDAEGTTNLSGGWLRGGELVAEHLRWGGVNRVLLLTDGQANVGDHRPHDARAPLPGRERPGGHHDDHRVRTALRRGPLAWHGRRRRGIDLLHRARRPGVGRVRGGARGAVVARGAERAGAYPARRARRRREGAPRLSEPCRGAGADPGGRRSLRP